MAVIIHHHLSYISSLFIYFILLQLHLKQISPVSGSKIPALIVFGDSTVDTGNNNGLHTVLKSNFAPYGRDFEGGRPTGRFCNGRVASDFFSEYLGLNKTLPAYLDTSFSMSDFVTGVNFASAGTGYDNTTTAVFNVIPLTKEIEYYKEYQQKLRDYIGVDKANDILSRAVYIMSMGTNDFLESYFLRPTLKIKYTVQEYEDHLISIAKNFVEEIYSLGARKITLAGLPPMGCLPLERTIHFKAITKCNEYYNNVALEYNAKLQAMLDLLSTQLPGIQLYFSDPYYIILQMIQTPSRFGMTESSKACCGTGYVEMSYLCIVDDKLSCPDAGKYVFWDSFHPSEKAYQILSQHIFNNVLYKFL